MKRLPYILSRSNLAVITCGPDTVLGMCALWPWPRRYDLGSRSWHTLGSWTTIVWNIIKIKLAVRSYGPDTDFQYMCTVTLTLEIWPWVKVMTHPWVMDINCVKYYQDPTWQWGVMARTWISRMCALWPWPWRYDLGSRSWHTLGSWTTIVWNYIQIGQGSTKLWPGHDVNRRTDRRTERVIPIYPQTPVYVHCDLDLGYDLGSRSWHYLGSWTSIVWNIIQIQFGSEELWPGHGFTEYVHSGLDLGDMTLGQGHNTPLGHGQQLCEILSRSNLAVRSYGLDTDFQYVCTVTLTLEIWPWVKVMTHP